MPIGALLPATTHLLQTNLNSQQVQGVPLHPKLFPQVTVSSESPEKTPSHEFLDNFKAHLVSAKQRISLPAAQIPMQAPVAQVSYPQDSYQGQVVPRQSMPVFGNTIQAEKNTQPVTAPSSANLTSSGATVISPNLPNGLTLGGIRTALVNEPPQFVVTATRNRQGENSGH